MKFELFVLCAVLLVPNSLMCKWSSQKKEPTENQKSEFKPISSAQSNSANSQGGIYYYRKHVLLNSTSKWVIGSPLAGRNTYHLHLPTQCQKCSGRLKQKKSLKQLVVYSLHLVDQVNEGIDVSVVFYRLTSIDRCPISPISSFESNPQAWAGCWIGCDSWNARGV